MTHATHRRWFGLLLGFGAGLAFSIVSQLANRVLMPGVPLYQPPFGAAGNVVAGVLLGTALGLLTAWPDTGARGVVYSSLLGAVVISVATLLTGSTASDVWARKITATVLIFVPVAGAIAPVLALFRWSAGREETAYRDGRAMPVSRIAFPAALVLGAAALGLPLVYSPLARTVTLRMETLIQQNRSTAAQTAPLPAPLQPPNVIAFTRHTQGAYTLQWDKDPDNKYVIPRPNTSVSDQSIVIARFADGYLLVCMYPSATGEPECRDFE